MKIFKVTIDNDPGEWKSGNDPEFLVLANTPEEAIEQIKSGKIVENYKRGKIIIGEKIDSNDYYSHEPYIRNSANIIATEIIFPGYVLTPIRQAKIEKLLED